MCRFRTGWMESVWARRRIHTIVSINVFLVTDIPFSISHCSVAFLVEKQIGKVEQVWINVLQN